LLLSFDNLVNRRLHEVVDDVISTPGVIIREMKFYDLVFEIGTDGFVGNGVYALKDSDKVVYVGKASSRPFIERWGGHLDLREEGGFNNLLKTIRSQNDLKSLGVAAKLLGDLNLVVVRFNKPEFMYIAALEKLFLNLWHPVYNKRVPKLRCNINVMENLRTILETF
jgi:hypothetical protein